jgi:hypothetical protein
MHTLNDSAEQAKGFSGAVCNRDTVSRHVKYSSMLVSFPIWTATGTIHTTGFVYTATCVEGIVCMCVWSLYPDVGRIVIWLM